MNLKGFMFLCFFALAHAQEHAYAQDVISRCRHLGFNAYADQLELYPEIVKRINKRGDTAIWAVSDHEVWAKFGNNTKIHKRAASDMANSATAKAPPPTKKRHQNAANYAETLYSYLEDPAFVNLGAGQPGRLVSKYAGSLKSHHEATFHVSSGLGAVTKQISGPFEFDKGVIFEVAG